jgi:hypothetical protein
MHKLIAHNSAQRVSLAYDVLFKSGYFICFAFALLYFGDTSPKLGVYYFKLRS